MNNKRVKVFLFSLTIISIVLYLFLWFYTTSFDVSKSAFISIVKGKFVSVLAIIIAGLLISSSSLVFQTITNNRLLTPSMLGFDAIYIATQTFIIFSLSESSIFFENKTYNFILSSIVMVLITLILYSLILKKNKNQVFILLLVGMVISTFVRSITSFVQRIMNPDELDTVLNSSMVSITNINKDIIYFVVPFVFIIIFLYYKNNKVLDTMSLGEDLAINLGVDYNKKTTKLMILISFSMAIATALVGPITFLGLLAVNLSKEILQTYKHKSLLFVSSLISIISLVLGQLLIEQFTLKVPVTVLINLIGGIYMIYMIWRVNSDKG